MSHFVNALAISEISRGTWSLLAPLHYVSDIGGAIVVPEGFITDLASVPRLPFAYLLTGGKANAAAVVHDWLYSTRKFDRATADAIFKEAIRASGHGWFTQQLMWLGVRLGGGFVWGADNLPQPPHIDLPPC